MKRIAAFIIFLALVVSDCLSRELSLGPGLSVKNALLYILVIWIMFEAVMNSSGGGILKRQFEYMSLHTAFIVLIILAMFSAAICVFIVKYEDYGILEAIISLKSALIDYYLMLFVFLAALATAKDATWTAKAMLIVLTIVMILSLVEMFELAQFQIMDRRGDGRLQSPQLNSNEYGALMAFYLPLTFVFAYQARGLQRAFWAMSLFVFFTVMIFSASRGAVVGLVGGVCIGLVLFSPYVNMRYVARSALVIFVVAGLSVALLSIEYSDLLYTRFVEQSMSTNTFDQTSGRTVIWGEALGLMSSVPATFLVGYGWATFELLNEFGSHNQYLQFLFELGLFGLALFVFILFNVLFQIHAAARAVNPETRLILIGFGCGYLSILFSITFNHMAAPWLFVWAMVGTMLRLAYAARFEKDEQPVEEIRSRVPEPSMRRGKESAAQARQ